MRSIQKALNDINNHLKYYKIVISKIGNLSIAEK